MIKDATAPNIHPTSKEPTASGIGEPVNVDRPMQTPARATLKTAAASSVSTTFTHGSCPLKTIKE